MPVSVAKADIESVWRPLTTDEAILIPGLSNRAWLRVQSRFPDIETTTAADLVLDVMVSMIIRVLKNPDSVRSDSIDDHTTTLDNAISSGEMYLTTEEIALLTPLPEVPNYGMYVVGLGG